jgi:hypothetical protein
VEPKKKNGSTTTIRLLKEPDLGRSTESVQSSREREAPWLHSASLSPPTPSNRPPENLRSNDHWNEKKSFSSVERNANRSVNKSSSILIMQDDDSWIQPKAHKDTQYLSFMDSKSLHGSAIQETQDGGFSPARPQIMRGLLKEPQQKMGQSGSAWAGRRSSLLLWGESQMRRTSPLRGVQGEQCDHVTYAR